MLKICSLKNFSFSSQFGGKANGLNELFSNGLNVPASFFIEATDDVSKIDYLSFQQELLAHLEEFKNQAGLYDIAIRSSALNEDGVNDSLAGHYDSILGLMSLEEIISGIKQVILSQKNLADSAYSNNKMGVVLQKFIRADYSGVIFSSNPLTFSKNESIVSFTDGCGDKLVSGEEEGTDVLITVCENELSLPINQEIPFGEQKLFELCQQVKALERRLGYPIDVEWTIREGVISYIQCRPLTSITKIEAMTARVDTKYLAGKPKQLLKSDKVAIRIEAQKKHTHISDAYVIISNDSNKQNPSNDLKSITRSPFCQGYSTVVIYPQRVLDKVVRSFIGDTRNLNLDSTGNQDSVIQSSPKYQNLNECVTDFVNRTKQDFWISTIIIQEIYAPKFTGVIKREGDNYMIEIIKGHFFTKGTIPPSNYLVTQEAEVISKHEVIQDEWYEISEGAVIRHKDRSNQMNRLMKQEIQSILDEFEPFLAEEEALIEFGLLEGDHKAKPYLIDLVKNSENLPELTSQDISQGILSHGKLTGKLVYVDLNDEESFDLHFHNNFNENSQNHVEKTIFVCKKTSIELLNLIHSNDSKKIAFVFESGSILCHLSIVLRENEIPAIQIGAFDNYDLEYGANYTVDAENEMLEGSKRLQKITES